MTLLQTRYVSVYLLLLIPTVSGEAIFTNLTLTQIPVSQIDSEETSIDLSRNLISRVEDNTFVLFSRLRTLDLSRNEISFLSDLAFKGTSISILYMTHNKLTALPRFASIGSSLQTLFVNRNLIERVGKDELKGVTRLQRFELVLNKLAFVHPEAFSDCANTLYWLKLSGSPRLTAIPAEIFMGMDQLYVLDIRPSSLISFPDFRYLPDDNNLTSLWITSRHIVDLTSDSLYKLGKLNLLFLQGLGLTSLPDLSRQRGILQYLILGSNYIRDIPFNAFDNLPLHYLGLQSNQLTRLPNLQPVRSTLTGLSLKFNNLSAVTCEDILEFISNCPLLDAVFFSYTNIKTFPDILQLNRSFIAVDILNPSTMQCDCGMEWMIRLEDQVGSTDVQGTSMPCAAPSRLVGREWSTISRTDLCQESEAVSCHSTPPLLPTFSTSLPGLVTTTIDKMAMMSQDYHDMMRTHSIDGSSSSGGLVTEGLSDEDGEKNILTAALGGALGVVLLLFVIVVVLLVCRMRSSSPSNQSRDKRLSGEDNAAYPNMGDGNRTYTEPPTHHTQLTEHSTNPDQINVYNEIDELVLGPVAIGAQGNNSAGQTGLVTDDIPVYKNVIKSVATKSVYQNVK